MSPGPVLLTPAQLPGELRIRLLGLDDAALLNRIADEDNVFDEDPAVAPSGAQPLDRAREFLADPSELFWVAEVQGAGERGDNGQEPMPGDFSGPTAGFLHCCVQRRRNAGPWAELLLMEMGTRTGLRRLGIGRAMLAAMEEWMRAHGVEEVWVPANLYAVEFYRKCGFAQDEGEILVKALG